MACGRGAGAGRRNAPAPLGAPPRARRVELVASAPEVVGDEVVDLLESLLRDHSVPMRRGVRLALVRLRGRAPGRSRASISAGGACPWTREGASSGSTWLRRIAHQERDSARPDGVVTGVEDLSARSAERVGAGPAQALVVGGVTEAGKVHERTAIAGSGQGGLTPPKHNPRAMAAALATPWGQTVLIRGRRKIWTSCKSLDWNTLTSPAQVFPSAPCLLINYDASMREERAGVILIMALLLAACARLPGPSLHPLPRPPGRRLPLRLHCPRRRRPRFPRPRPKSRPSLPRRQAAKPGHERPTSRRPSSKAGSARRCRPLTRCC